MKEFLLLILLLFVSGCSAHQHKLAWRVKDMALEQTPLIRLQGHNEQIVLSVPTRTIQEMTLAHLRIGRSANVQSDLYIVEATNPMHSRVPIVRAEE